jgi:hypothetical protein
MASILIPISLVNNNKEIILNVSFDDVPMFNRYYSVPTDFFDGKNTYCGLYKGFYFKMVDHEKYWCGYVILDCRTFNKIVVLGNNHDTFDNVNVPGDFTYINPRTKTIGFDFAHYTDTILDRNNSFKTIPEFTYKTRSYVRNECVKTIDSIIAFLGE